MNCRLLSSLQAAVLAGTIGSFAWEGCAHHAAPAIKNDLFRSGFQTSAASPDNPEQHYVVIWSNHKQVVQPLRLWLEELQGGTGDYARLQQAFNEQRSGLLRVPYDADLLHDAQQVGADDIIVADITIKPSSQGFHTYVAIRAFAVATRAMQWSGTAHCALPVRDPWSVVIALARIAVGTGMGRSADEPLLQQDLQICR